VDVLEQSGGARRKPQLHNSHLETLFQCGHRYHLAYQLGMSQRQSVAMLTGSVVHAVAAQNLRLKSLKRPVMESEELDDLTRDAFEAHWTLGVDLMGDEVERGEEVVYGAAVDRSLALSRMHAEKLLPLIRPAIGGVERAWVVEVDGLPWDLAGEMDCIEDREVAADGATVVFPSSIRDLKTTGRKPTAKLVSTAGQLGMYSLAYHAEHKAYPDRVFFDYAMTTKAGTPDAGSFGSVRGGEHVEAVWNRLEIAAAIIEKEVFSPSIPYRDTMCSPEYCPFARPDPETGVERCRYFRAAPTFVALSFTNNTGGSDGKKQLATPEQRRRLLDEL